MKKIICWLLCAIIITSTSMCAFALNDDEAITVKAKAAVLMDASTGEILFCKNEHERLYPASVTKIMPLLLFMEAIDSGKMNLSDIVTTSPTAASKGGSQIWLKEGEQMTVEELLRATAIGSANDACTALGEALASSEEAFVKMMNERAKELGMNDTNFVNCTGLDDDTSEHLTSAYDIALMSKELLSHERIQNYTTVWMDSLRDGATQLVNTNKLVRFYSGTTGLKTGTTSKAGNCLSASAMREGLHLIAVVLGSETSSDRFEGAKAMLNWGFSNYETVTPEIDENLLTDVRVLKGVEEYVTPEIKSISPLTLKSGQSKKIEQILNLSTDVESPVENNQVLGTLTLKIEDEVISEYNITAKNSVEKITLPFMLRRILTSLSARNIV